MGHEKHFLAQAKVAPMDVDGLSVVMIGIVGFALASMGCLVFRSALQSAGHGWWLWVCLTGFGLGLIGLLYCWNRRRRRQAGLLTD